MKKNLIYAVVTAILSSLLVYWQEPANFCFSQECLRQTFLHVGKDIFLVLFGLNSARPAFSSDSKVEDPTRLN